MKKVLSLAVAAALAAPMAVMADATIYGKVRLSLDNVDDGDDSQVEIASQTSRLGVKGSEDLGNGLKAVYKLEFGVDIAGAQTSQDFENPNITSREEFGAAQPFSARNAYVGLAGDFGTALIGRHDTPLKMSTGKLDYFADTSADFNLGYMGSFSDRRADGVIAYISPNWSGFTVAGAIIPGENADANGLADAYSLAGMYSNAGIYLSAAYEAADKDTDLLIQNDGTVGDHTQWRVGGGYDAGDWKVGAVYENEAIENEAGGDDLLDVTRWAISGAVKLGMGMVKATYQDADDDPSTANVTSWALGYDYNMSKRTQVYALYLDSTEEEDGFDDVDVSVFSVGLNHNF